MASRNVVRDHVREAAMDLIYAMEARIYFGPSPEEKGGGPGAVRFRDAMRLRYEMQEMAALRDLKEALGV